MSVCVRAGACVSVEGDVAGAGGVCVPSAYTYFTAV